MTRGYPHPRFVSARSPELVPFVELFDGRLQGVVWSGGSYRCSHLPRIESSSGDHACCTDAGRPCESLAACGRCTHLDALVTEAVARFGAARVAGYLGLSGPEDRAHRIVDRLGGRRVDGGPGEVFARFRNYVGFLQLTNTPARRSHP